MACALGKKHIDVAWWLYEHAPFNGGPKVVRELIEFFFLNVGYTERAESLLPQGKNIFEYVLFRSVSEVIELMMDRGYYTRRQERVGEKALQILVKNGRLDLVQRLVNMYPPPEAHAYYWGQEWRSAMNEACRCGHLRILQCLMDHPTRTNNSRVTEFIQIASCAGHVGLMQYIYNHETTTIRDVNMLHAISSAVSLKELEWLMQRFPKSVRHSADDIT